MDTENARRLLDEAQQALIRDLDSRLAQLSRDYSEQWQIEAIPHGTEWIAIDRDTSGDYIRVIPARNLHALRFRLAEAERDEPEQRKPPSASLAPLSDIRTPPAPRPRSGQRVRPIIVRR